MLEDLHSIAYTQSLICANDQNAIIQSAREKGKIKEKIIMVRNIKGRAVKSHMKSQKHQKALNALQNLSMEAFCSVTAKTSPSAVLLSTSENMRLGTKSVVPPLVPDASSPDKTFHAG
jgi:hypothetical protein